MQIPGDLDAFTVSVIERVSPYTLTSADNIAALVDAVRYLCRRGVAGAFVECGVWRGGSIMVMAHTLLAEEKADREIYLFDTFDETPRPGVHDYILTGEHVDEFFDELLGIDELKRLPTERLWDLLVSTGYPPERLHLVPGMVEDTLPGAAPETIALCRLDTDLYQSTAHEMKHLWPRIGPGGVLIVDDYGHFLGARKAVDEYFAEQDVAVFLHRADSTARVTVKPS